MFIELLLTFHISLKSGRFRVLWHASGHPNNKYHCFSWSCSKFQCLHVSHRTVCSCYVMNAGIVQCKFHQFDQTDHFSFKIAPTRNQNKIAAFAIIKRHLQLQQDSPSPTNRHQPKDTFWGVVTTGTLLQLASSYCLLFFLAFDWFRQAFFLKLDSLPVFKGNSPLKLYTLILNWTVR